ncbi:MAG TPA: TetR/AcrR family transcriptional regulator [Solirubrobacteraceae bacterium]|jgi:AcrR family transcriptional regulator
MVEVVAELGFAGASVGPVCARAGVSRRTFYELFDGLEDCFLAILDLAQERTGKLILHALQHERSWTDGVRAALAALLEFFEAEPRLARVWLVESLAAGAWALERRERNLSALRTAVVSWWSGPELTASGLPSPVVAAGVMASLLGIIQGHMVSEGERGPLIELLGPLTGLAVGPFLDGERVAEEVQRGRELAQKIQAGRELSRSPSGGLERKGTGVEIPALFHNAKAKRARACVLYLAVQDRQGLRPSNREIATGIGIAHKEQASKLLTRLENAGILSKFSHGVGRPNAWWLTPYGQEIAAHFSVREEAG